MTKLNPDWLIHEPVRLNLMIYLAEAPHCFTEVMKELELTKGNFISHVRLLEAAGYLYRNCNERTTYILTAAGRAALIDYFEQSQRLTCILATALSMTTRFAMATNRLD